MKIIVLIVILIGILMYTIVATSKSEYEQRVDNEAQMEYLKQYRENKNK